MAYYKWSSVIFALALVAAIPLLVVAAPPAGPNSQAATPTEAMMMHDATPTAGAMMHEPTSTPGAMMHDATPATMPAAGDNFNSLLIPVLASAAVVLLSGLALRRIAR